MKWAKREGETFFCLNVSVTPSFIVLGKVTDNIVMCGLVYGLGDNRRALGMSAHICESDKNLDTGYYELNAEMKLLRKDDPATHKFINEKFAIPKNVVAVEESSVLVIDDKCRWICKDTPSRFS
ncbi:MAG: hypothetical protein U9R60_18790 [Bacteroidota bacterium]|nr:hypothetical protein [Bacteroidota bacterium]